MNCRTRGPTCDVARQAVRDRGEMLYTLYLYVVQYPVFSNALLESSVYIALLTTQMQQRSVILTVVCLLRTILVTCYYFNLFLGRET